MTNVSYRIKSQHLAAHLFEVILPLATPAAEGTNFLIAGLIPGSYMVREFARNIVQIKAHSKGKKVALKNLIKVRGVLLRVKALCSFRVPSVCLGFIGARRPSRSSHGFFNGTSVFCARRFGTSAACG